ncbi:MAG TPA: hypothetical protein H9823_08960, partial [Candidatus Rubneribacter avistercoris]|nr:hypothetical protein [Candidatus Rubneribacter avistercoris]
ALTFISKIESKLDGLKVFFIHNLLPSFECPACYCSVQTAIAINPHTPQLHNCVRFMVGKLTLEAATQHGYYLFLPLFLPEALRAGRVGAMMRGGAVW